MRHHRGHDRRVISGLRYRLENREDDRIADALDIAAGGLAECELINFLTVSDDVLAQRQHTIPRLDLAVAFRSRLRLWRHGLFTWPILRGFCHFYSFRVP